MGNRVLPKFVTMFLIYGYIHMTQEHLCVPIFIIVVFYDILYNCDAHQYISINNIISALIMILCSMNIKISGAE